MYLSVPLSGLRQLICDNYFPYGMELCTIFDIVIFSSSEVKKWPNMVDYEDNLWNHSANKVGTELFWTGLYVKYTKYYHNFYENMSRWYYPFCHSMTHPLTDSPSTDSLTHSLISDSSSLPSGSHCDQNTFNPSL